MSNENQNEFTQMCWANSIVHQIKVYESTTGEKFQLGVQHDETAILKSLLEHLDTEIANGDFETDFEDVVEVELDASTNSWSKTCEVTASLEFKREFNIVLYDVVSRMINEFMSNLNNQ